jgi:hypothetical protein
MFRTPNAAYNNRQRETQEAEKATLPSIPSTWTPSLQLPQFIDLFNVYCFYVATVIPGCVTGYLCRTLQAHPGLDLSQGTNTSSLGLPNDRCMVGTPVKSAFWHVKEGHLFLRRFRMAAVYEEGVCTRIVQQKRDRAEDLGCTPTGPDTHGIRLELNFAEVSLMTSPSSGDQDAIHSIREEMPKLPWPVQANVDRPRKHRHRRSTWESHHKEIREIWETQDRSLQYTTEYFATKHSLTPS